jgi:hypothetical protein
VTLHGRGRDPGEHRGLLAPPIRTPVVADRVHHATAGQAPMDAPLDGAQQTVHLVVGGWRLRFELNVLNVSNRKTARHRLNYLNRARPASDIDLSRTNLADGYDFNAMIDARPDPAGARDPRYGMDDLFGEGTSGHALVRWLF